MNVLVKLARALMGKSSVYNGTMSFSFLSGMLIACYNLVVILSLETKQKSVQGSK
jgi:hypothetical protein